MELDQCRGHFGHIGCFDVRSLASVPIQQFFNDLPLGNASAFVWVEHESHYLITNWHVVTMIDPNTDANLHSKAARPSKLRAEFNPRPQEWGKHERNIPLYDCLGRPLWLVHAAHKRKIDVVAIPLEPPEDFINFYPINRMKREDELAIRISMDCYVLGYPFGAPAPGFPVWKRGSIASEPELAGPGNQYFLILPHRLRIPSWYVRSARHFADLGYAYVGRRRCEYSDRSCDALHWRLFRPAAHEGCA